MINIKTFDRSQIIFGLALSIIAFALISIPNYSYAATYAFVNTSDEVSMIVSNTANEAIRDGQNIAAHSGVMLLNSSNMEIVGDRVNN